MSSIRVRLLVSLLVLLGLTAIAIAAITYRNVLAETESLFDYQLQQMALSLRDQGQIDSSEASTLADQKLDVVIQIWTVDGRSIYASRPHSALPARALLGLATLSVEGQAWRTYSVATRDRVIQVAQPVQIRQRLAAHAAWLSVLPLLLMTPLAAFAIWWLAAKNLAPLERLAGEVRSRDAGSLDPVPTGDLPDEVAPLAQALNALLDRLKSSLDTQRAFVADAAHELRSPLTALKLQLRLLRHAGDDAARAAAIEGISAGIERAARLIEQLLTLARSEPGAAPLAREPVDLAGLARETLAAMHPFALDRGSELILDAERPVIVDGDRASLSALVRNLVDNALRYSPPKTRIDVAVGDDARSAWLRVDDAGPGIPAAERARVFDRFYRRQSGSEDGTGLGLAIVHTVAARHDAELSLDASPAGGLRVLVRFPRRGGAAASS
ncbi:MAG: ATP-binding protein [Caldimonas sp.]